MRLRLILLCALAAFALAATADAAPRTVLLGVLGNSARFDALSGQRTTVGHVIVGWDQGRAWGGSLTSLFEKLGPVPMLGLNTDRGGREAITPLQIANGDGDAFLAAINKAVSEWDGDRIYIRPFGEMNGHWNFYCAYDKNGTPRDVAHATAAFRKAFARVYLVVHGGDAAAIDVRLKRLGMPPLRVSGLAANPMPRVRVIWNPQGYGSPDLPGNSAQAYYPGDAFVDVVGNDLYNIRGKAEWGANEKLYDAHPGKPYAFPEWANWSVDDPAFVATMAEFVKTHRRVEMLAWFHGNPGSPWDLASKPKTRAAYKRLIAPLGTAL